MKNNIFPWFILLFFLVFIVIGIQTIKIEKIDINNPESQTIVTEDILMQVINGEKEFINSNGKEILIDSLVIEDVPVKINQYSFVDLDDDKNNELVAITDSYYEYYLVLHIDNNIIYGYTIPFSEIDIINNDGVIYDTLNSSTYYRRLKFNKGVYKKVNIASSTSDEYIVNGEVCDQAKFLEFEDEYAKAGYIIYKSINTKWMEKRLSLIFSLKNDNYYYTKTGNLEVIFATDNNFSSFKEEISCEKFNLYYLTSDGNDGRVIIKKNDDDMLKFSDELFIKKNVGIYDENTQYIAIVISNDKLNSTFDNNYFVYYFKYYNKNIQFLGSHIQDSYDELFNEDVISDLQ